jgi:hypothetical protein
VPAELTEAGARSPEGHLQSRTKTALTRETLPHWQVKRAALLAETGRIEEAVKEATEALARGRSGQVAGTRDYMALSEEGWAVVLLDVLRYARSPWTLHEDDPFNGRLEVLERSRCNPAVELDPAEQRLRGPAPEPPVRLFWPEAARRHVTALASELESHLPAFRLLRAADEGGRPVRAGQVVVQQKEAVEAAEWIAPLYPVWANEVVLRHGDDDQALDWFDPVRVAGMSQEAVDDLAERLLTSMLVAAHHLSGHPGAVWTPEGQFPATRFKVYAAVLGHLAFRLRPEHVDRLLEVATALYRADFIRGDHAYSGAMRNLLEGVLRVAPADILRRHLRALVELPVPGAPGFEVKTETVFPEPFHWLPPDWFGDSMDGSATESLTPSVRVLIDMTAAPPSPAARRRCVDRLWFLNVTGHLTEEERASFGRALWSQVDEATGLPSGTRLLPQGFLDLPEPEPGLALQRVREYLNSRAFPRITSLGRYDGDPEYTLMFGGRRQTDFARALTGVTKDRDPARRQPRVAIGRSRQRPRSGRWDLSCASWSCRTSTLRTWMPVGTSAHSSPTCGRSVCTSPKRGPSCSGSGLPMRLTLPRASVGR